MIKGLLALLVIAASGGGAYYLVRGPGPPFDPSLHQAIGRAMAEQAVSLAAEGGRIVILARDLRIVPNPSAETQLKSLTLALAERKHPAAVTNLAKADPLRPLRFPPGDFVELLRRSAENDVIVSLLGPPDFRDAQYARVPAKKPKVVALCTGSLPRQIDLKKLFEEQLLQVAIVSRSELVTRYPAAASTQRTFENLCAVITSNNVSELAVYAK